MGFRAQGIHELLDSLEDALSLKGRVNLFLVGIGESQSRNPSNFLNFLKSGLTWIEMLRC